jgi:hypothetical protein
MGIASSLLVLGGIVLFVFVLRLLGAWMLRIDELIKLLWVIKEILEIKLSQEEKIEVKKKTKSRG